MIPHDQLDREDVVRIDPVGESFRAIQLTRAGLRDLTDERLPLARVREPLVVDAYAGQVMWHMEGGKGQVNKLLKFQVRPDPLAK